MEKPSRELQSALLKWINTFALQSSVRTWRDVGNGEVLWAVLKDIDDEYFIGELPEDDRGNPENWIPRWQNLKHICRMVESYLREECECLLYLSRNLVPDLKSVAIEWSPGSTAKLVQAVFVAAMYSPKSNERMVKVMESLGTKVALPLANAIAEMQELDKRLAEQTISTEPNTNNSSSLGSNNGIGRDPELESEEKLIQAHASIKKLEGENIEQATQLKALRNHTSDLERQMNEAKNKIEAQQHGVSEGQALKDLKAKYARDKDYIAELETDMDSSRAVLEARQRELERLKADATNKQDLRDEIQVLKIERDELMSKAKANENLRKKIESLQNEEKRNQELQKQLQASNESLEQFVEIEKTCEILRKARAESQKTIANQEVEIFHIKDTKKRVENELEILARELRDTTGQISSYEEIIADLQARLNEMESEQAGKGIGLGNLDEEIVRKELEDELRQRQAIIYWQRGLINYSKLNDVKKPENFSISNDTNAAHLQQKLDALHKRNSKMETDFLETANENRGLRNLVKTTTEDQEAEYQTFKKHFGDAAANWPDSDTPFSRQQNALHAARQEAQDYKEKYLDTMSKLSDIQARWATSVDSSESTERVHRYTKSLDVKSGQRKISADESSLASSGVAVTNAGKGSDAGDKDPAGQDKSLAEELEKLKEEYKSRAEQFEKSEATISALERELRLMMSSWYDLGSRMQSSHVTLQKRPVTPRSWIGRQRALVGGTLRT